MIKYDVPGNYLIITSLDLKRRSYNTHNKTSIGFPDWLKQQYNCTIEYQYNTTVINCFIFENDSDYNWFILKEL